MGERKGWFERADGGSLFLDECGELPLAAQVRLLRVLQDGSMERVGGERQLHVDVRVIAATHRDLRAMVADGRFREDLWYRIAVFPIRLPALRDRTEDIPTLASHFALCAAKRLGIPPVLPTFEDIKLLREYSWPGNVRELAAVIERAAILGAGARLEISRGPWAQRPPREPPRPTRRELPNRPPCLRRRPLRLHWRWIRRSRLTSKMRCEKPPEGSKVPPGPPPSWPSILIPFDHE